VHDLFSDKRKVLLHHPDKRKASGKTVEEGDDYFTNITKGITQSCLSLLFFYASY